jgi:hypothetical protein
MLLLWRTCLARNLMNTLLSFLAAQSEHCNNGYEADDQRREASSRTMGHGSNGESRRGTYGSYGMWLSKVSLPLSDS